MRPLVFVFLLHSFCVTRCIVDVPIEASGLIKLIYDALSTFVRIMLLVAFSSVVCVVSNLLARVSKTAVRVEVSVRVCPRLVAVLDSPGLHRHVPT